MRLYDPITRAKASVDGQLFFNRLSDLLFDLQIWSDPAPSIKRSWLKNARNDIRASLLMNGMIGKMDYIRGNHSFDNSPLSDWDKQDLRLSERCLSEFLKAATSPRIIVFTR